MRLLRPENTHLSEMMTWFDNQDDLETWAGPNFHYPYSSESFVKDLKLDQLDSFVFVSNKMNLLGFGQCYQRLSCCHLSRLIISPTHRGQNLIDTLIRLLSEYGTKNIKRQLAAYSYLKIMIQLFESIKN